MLHSKLNDLQRWAWPKEAIVFVLHIYTHGVIVISFRVEIIESNGTIN